MGTGHPVNIHDGTTRTLNPSSLLALAQTFEMVFAQYIQHPESKNHAPDGTACKADTHGLLKRYRVTASAFHLIGKETERGWEQSEDISTLLPSLMRYHNSSVAGEQLRQRLLCIPLGILERETGLSRDTILKARQGKQVQARTLELLTHTALLGYKRQHARAKHDGGNQSTPRPLQSGKIVRRSEMD